MQRPGSVLNAMPGADPPSVVIDCSMLVDVITDRIGARLDGLGLHAPTLIDYEFASAAARLDRQDARGVLGTEMLVQLRGTSITRHHADALMPLLWETRHRISLSDGAYVALCRLLGAPLMTRDRRLATSAVAFCEVIVPE